jgi:hypothetical protein
MAGLSTITVDLVRGEVVLGGRRVVLAPVADPDVPTAAEGARGASKRFRLEDGALVRLITFGERSSLVKQALANEAPSQALMSLLRGAAHAGPCSTLSDAVLLATAGAAEDAPEFDRCAIDASRLQALSWLSVHDTPAIVIDRALAPAVSTELSGGWNRFVFGSSDIDLETLRREMVALLLARGMPASSEPRTGNPDAGDSTDPVGIAQPIADAVPTGTVAPSSLRAASWRAGANGASAAADDTIGRAAPDLPSASGRPWSAQSGTPRLRASRRPLPLREAEPEARASAAATPGQSAVTVPQFAPPASQAMPRSAAWPARPMAVASSGSPRAASVRSQAAAETNTAWTAPPSALPYPAPPFTVEAAAFRRSSNAAPAVVPHEVAALVAPSISDAVAHADPIDAIGRALAAECDLRGIDA